MKQILFQRLKLNLSHKLGISPKVVTRSAFKLYHLARYTFATSITLSNGVPIETISQMIGHNSLKTTHHYAKVIDTKVSTEMSVLQEKLLDRYKKEEDNGDMKVMKLFR